DVNNDGKVDDRDMHSGNDSGEDLPIVGLGFGSGELSGSILIVQEQRTRGGANAGIAGGSVPGSSDNPKDGIESTQTCALDSSGVRVCLPPNPEGKPPTTHTWTELRYDDAP
ncbi:MAG: hypothetical protein II058_00790, partial [Rhodocyclaceae bacterium]|nr:hypothetical protein [Rhodocyclaceae bacterium]